MDGWRPPERYLSSTQVNKCVYVAIPGTPNTLSTVIKLGPERPQHTPLHEAAAADDDDDAGDNNMAHRYTYRYGGVRVAKSIVQVERYLRVCISFISFQLHDDKNDHNKRSATYTHITCRGTDEGMACMSLLWVGGMGKDGGRMSIKWNWKLLLLHGTWWWVGNKVRSFIFQSIYVRVI